MDQSSLVFVWKCLRVCASSTIYGISSLLKFLLQFTYSQVQLRTSHLKKYIFMSLDQIIWVNFFLIVRLKIESYKLVDLYIKN